MADIPQILNYLRPGEEWSLEGDSYDGLVWLDTTKKPTMKEIEAAGAKVDASLAAEEQAKQDARTAALAKLAKLGLTPDDLAAIVSDPIPPQTI